MGGKTKVQTTTSQSKADIPDFLKPYLETAGGVGNTALQQAGDYINNAGASDLVAGFTPAQQASFSKVLEYVGGQDANRQAGIDTLQQANSGNAVDALVKQTQLLKGTPQGAISAAPVSQNSQQVFNSLMNGNFINSEGFNANVDASIRAAQPYINSGFAKSGGVGATNGGLAKVAMQQAASDSFARLYGDERNRQLGAAQAQTQAEAQRAQAAALMSQAAAAREGNRISERGLMANLANQERNRQMLSSGELANIGLMDADLLNQMGTQQQNQNQNQLTAPLNAQLGLAQTAGSVIPANVIGNTTTQQTPYKSGGIGQILGGALTLGSLIPGASAGFGMLGGLLGGGQSMQTPSSQYYGR